jgi:hypothetical protein
VGYGVGDDVGDGAMVGGPTDATGPATARGCVMAIGRTGHPEGDAYSELESE